MDHFRTVAVVNPNSANGRTGKDWPQIEKAIRRAIPDVEVVMTDAPGDATEKTRKALNDGFEMVVSVGGDGTNNEVVNGFFTKGKPVKGKAVFGVLSRGTGSDLIKTLGIPKAYEESAPRLAGRDTAPLDVGKMTYVTHAGRTAVRYFINIASFGIGGDVDRRVNETTKFFGGKASFLWASLMGLLRWTNKPVTIRIDDGEPEDLRMFSGVVANGQYFGGGMWVAPQAKMDDGRFDVVLMGDLSRAEVMTSMTRIYKGRHFPHPKVRYTNARVVRAESDAEVLIDLDGEQPGRLPATFEILPGAIRIKT